MMTETLLTGTARKGEIPGWQARRQDRHQPGLARRLVRRLHEPARDRRMARQRRFLADQEGLRRQPADGDLVALHEGGDGRPSRPCRFLTARRRARRSRAPSPPTVFGIPLPGLARDAGPTAEAAPRPAPRRRDALRLHAAGCPRRRARGTASPRGVAEQVADREGVRHGSLISDGTNGASRRYYSCLEGSKR